MEIDTSVVAQIIVGILFSGGAGFLASQLIDSIPKLAELTFGWKRVAAWGLSIGISWLVYAFALWLGYFPVPETAQMLVETLITLGAVAVTTNQARHGREKIKELNGS